ncbi:hypothetical protein [Rhizobium leguminosarum]|uniref:hypothetical protein n=1 Tax=Rhizobium leguminosarum TaxID=384 RepID=UPI003F986442
MRTTSPPPFRKLGIAAAAIYLSVFAVGNSAAMSEPRLVSTLPKSDPVRQVVRSMGFVLEINQRVHCPALLLSKSVALQGQCRHLNGFPDEYVLQMSGIEHVSHRGSKYSMGPKPAERHADWGENWIVYKVKGDPSRYFGTAKLSVARPKIGDELVAIGWRTRTKDRDPVVDITYRSDCKVTDHKTEDPGHFAYVCGEPRKGGEFLLLKSDASLVGIGQENNVYEPNLVAIPITELRKRSKLVASIPDKRTSAEADAAAIEGLTCASASAFAFDPGRMSELSWDVHDKITVFVHGCAAQVSMNKWKAPVDREIVVIRPDGVGADGATTYALQRVKRDDRSKIINACWTAGPQSKKELLSTIRPMTGQDAGGVDWSEMIGCAGISSGFATNIPFMLTDSLTSDEIADVRKFFDGLSQPDLGKSVVRAWEDVQDVVDLTPGALKGPASDETVQVGTIQKRCLFSWDDSIQPHSTEVIFRWDYQSVKLRMKKLRHCVELTVVGPLNVEGIAKEFVSECINSALNDDKALHILKGLIAIAIDIGSAGATGGSATAAAASDYALAVKDRALSCLTDEKQIGEFLANRAGAKISASVKNESHWIFWNM